MAAPVIEIRTSLQVSTVGTAFTFSPAALNVPTSWAALYLPTGLSINTSTGAITGTPTTEGHWQTVLSATNVDGTDRVVLQMPVLPAEVIDPKDPFDMYLDFDSSSLLVSVPGQSQPEDGEPLFYAPVGTNRNLYIGVLVDGDFVDCDPDTDGLTIKMGLKELETERLIELTTGTPTMVELANDVIRYRQAFRITPGNWSGVLLDYEDDGGTMVAALAEIQVTRGTSSSLHDATLTDSSIAIQGGITSAITGDHDFTGIAEFAVATPMRLTLTLTVAGRVLQTVALVRTFDLVFTGGAFVLSNLSGATTGQGAEEGDHWRATLNLTGLAGDANSVDCDYSITTTNEVAPNFVWEIAVIGGGDSGDLTDPDEPVSLAPQPILSLWDETDTEIGTGYEMASSYASTTAFFAAIAAEWDTLAGTAEIVSVTAVDATTVRITVGPGTLVRGVGWDDDDPPATIQDPTITAGVAGEATTCSVVAHLEQLSDPTTVPLNLTSRQFRIGIPRDIVPDPT